jgi:transposase-like protein
LTQEDAFMPWKETRTVDQRLQFLSSYQREEMSVTDLCHEYGISRPTAYKWIKRYDEVGPQGLLDLTRTPHSSPYATSAEIENESFQYPRSFQTRRVNNSGDISWHKGRVFVSEVFRNEEIGLEQMDEDVHRVFFCNTELGEFNSSEMRFRPALRA